MSEFTNEILLFILLVSTGLFFLAIIFSLNPVDSIYDNNSFENYGLSKPEICFKNDFYYFEAMELNSNYPEKYCMDKNGARYWFRTDNVQGVILIKEVE